MPYVFSTLTCDQRYVEWERGGSDLPVQGRSVLVKGGTGIANDRFITPLGVMTQVSDDEMKLLEANHHFKEHKDKGFIVVQAKKSDPEKVASGMELKDKSAPITPSDYKDAEVGDRVVNFGES